MDCSHENMVKGRLSIGQRIAARVGADLAAEDQNPFDQTPDGTGNAAAEHEQDHLTDPFFVIAEIEVVNAQPAQKDAQQSGDQPALAGRHSRVGRRSAIQPRAAVDAERRVRLCGLAALRAEAPAGTCRRAAVTADSILIPKRPAAGFTVHRRPLLCV